MIFIGAISLEDYLLYFSFLGLVVIVILLIIIYFKCKKELKMMSKIKRKRDKKILKFLSNKKNKTY